MHDSCSPSNHVATKHWEKQHHAVTSLFCRSLVACWTAGNSDAVVCFCQPSSAEIALNAEKLPFVFVGASKTPHLIGDTHDPCTQTFEHPVPCHNPALRETAPCRCQPCLSVVGCLLNSRKLWCSGLLLSAYSVELQVFVGASNTMPQTFEHHVPCHNTTPWEVGSSMLHWGPYFWFAKSCPSGLVCVWKDLNQRVSAGGHPCHHWWMANEEVNDESCKRTCEFLTSDMARWLSHKPPMPTWHDNITWHDFISSHFILCLRGVSKCVFDRNLMLVTCFYRFLFINQVSPYGMKNQSWEYPVYTHISECGEWWDETYFHILPLIMGFPL